MATKVLDLKGARPLFCYLLGWMHVAIESQTPLNELLFSPRAKKPGWLFREIRSLLGLGSLLSLGWDDCYWLLWCWLLLADSLRHKLSNGVGSSLSVAHDLEALKIGEVGTGLSNGELLCDGGLGPLLRELEFLGGGQHGASACSTLEWKDELGQGESPGWVEDSWEVFSVNEDTVLISDIDNDNKLAIIFAVVNERDSTGLHE